MSVLGAFSKVEITALKQEGSYDPLINILEGLYATISPLDLAMADAFGRKLINVVQEDPKPGDWDRLIGSVKAEVCGGKHIDSVAEAAIRLSRLLDAAPVAFDFSGVLVKARSFDRPQDVVARFHQGMKEYDRRRAAERDACKPRKAKRKSPPNWPPINCA